MQPSLIYQVMNLVRGWVFLKERMPFCSHKGVICFSSLMLAKLHLPRGNVFFQFTQWPPKGQQKPWEGWLKVSPGQCLDISCLELVRFYKEELFKLQLAE